MLDRRSAVLLDEVVQDKWIDCPRVSLVRTGVPRVGGGHAGRVEGGISRIDGRNERPIGQYAAVVENPRVDMRDDVPGELTETLQVRVEDGYRLVGSET